MNEACDLGPENSDTGACKTDCSLQLCGDGFVGPEEACDDANANDFDTCTTQCTSSPEAPALELSFSQVKKFDFSWAAALGAKYYQLLESPAAGEDYVQIGEDLFVGSTSVAMPLHLRWSASYKLRACNGNGCADSDPLDIADAMPSTMVPAIGYFKASNTSSDDNFGESLVFSADGSMLAVADQGEARVYLFRRDAMDGWSLQATVQASIPDYGDEFGNSLALSADGSTLAVGACAEESNATGIDGDQANNSAVFAGAVYVFQRDAMDDWTQQAYIKAPNTGWYDYFGQSVALSADGDTLAVGSHWEDSNATGINGNWANESANAAGAVFMFQRDAMDVWTQNAYIKASNSNASDAFGQSVALSADGDTLAVGAYYESSNATGIAGDQANNSAPTAGAVYVFQRNMGTWAQQAYVKASNTGAGDLFGTSVALAADGDTLAVGASQERSNATNIGGDQANNSKVEAGAAYVFRRDPWNVWAQEAYVKASNTNDHNFFGTSVTLAGDGSLLAIGAFNEGSSAKGVGGDQTNELAYGFGAVYVYRRVLMNTWTPAAYVKASNSDGGDSFGSSVALSGDGNTMAVGAPLEESKAKGIGGNQFDNSAFNAGAVYVY